MTYTTPLATAAVTHLFPNFHAYAAPIDNGVFHLVVITAIDFYIILLVVLVVAGPIFGILGLRFYEYARERDPDFAVTAMPISVAAIPTVTLFLLIADPRFSLINHQEQIMWGLLIGLLGLIVGGITLAVKARRHRAKMAAEKEADIATSSPDLPNLRAACEVAAQGCLMRFRRLRRLSKEDRATQTGTRLAYTCGRLRAVTICLSEVVDLLDGSERISPEDDDVREVVAEEHDRIEASGEPNEIIPLKGAADLKLLH